MRTFLYFVFVIAAVFFTRSAAANDLDDKPSGDMVELEEPVLDDELIYDISARFNEAVNANVDAIDNALIAVLIGVFIIAIFLIDKIHELSGALETAGLWFLGAATLLAGVGYAWGSPLYERLTARDGVLPRAILRDMVDRPEEALDGAIAGMLHAGEMSLGHRQIKRALVIFAIVALVVGTVLVGMARNAEKS